MKKAIISAAVLIPLIITGVVGFKIRYKQMSERLLEEHKTVSAVPLHTLKDGLYRGTYKEFLVDVTVEATISSGTMTKLQITDQKAGPGYEAHETVNRILQAQSPKVDAITGATGSSMGIMVATHRALTK